VPVRLDSSPKLNPREWVLPLVKPKRNYALSLVEPNEG